MNQEKKSDNNKLQGSIFLRKDGKHRNITFASQILQGTVIALLIPGYANIFESC